MGRARWTAWASALVAAASAACSSGDGVGESGSGGTTSGAGGDAVVCDGKADCDACQRCSYAKGGPCYQEESVCVVNADCTALNDCVTDCLGTGGAGGSGGSGGGPDFGTCRTQCEVQHPAGTSDYADVVACVDKRACISDCEF